MFKFTNNTFHVTRGDSGSITIAYKDGTNLPAGAPVCFRVYKKDELDSDPVIDKTVSIGNNDTSITIELESEDTTAKMENPENGKEEYWYELKVGASNTVLGYDETGAKIFYLYPSGKDKTIN